MLLKHCPDSLPQSCKVDLKHHFIGEAAEVPKVEVILLKPPSYYIGMQSYYSDLADSRVSADFKGTR